MFYELSVVLVVLGIAALAILGTRVTRLLRRYGDTASMVSTSTRDHLGLLRARWAALRVAVGGRRRRTH
ncbi:bacteriophage holin [Saccharomonospora marina]|uniref:bacteriophage holin n=1 Tax=Saccharomonospora marina TaxID=632569 RepID=UPI0005930A5D|nr:bacteriophage holin [Saccharomonospora marina]